MQRRGLSAVLLVIFMWGGTTGIALAASTTPSPGPTINPPAMCFVMKNNALPTCEQNSDGTWTAIYPDGATTTGSGSGSGSTGSSGGGNTRRDLGIAVMVAALLGVAVIVWRTWVRPTTPGAARVGADRPLDATTAPPDSAGLSDYYAGPPVVQQPPPGTPPVEPPREPRPGA